jgi:molecular chaperone GrpE (heat shock protein)
MVHRQFVEVLRKFGVEKIEALGEEFSPRVHEAVFVSEVDDPEKDGVVLREIQKGFIMDDRVIRPARVEVGKYSAEAGDKK